MIMYTFSGSIMLSSILLLSLLNGFSSGHPLPGGRLKAREADSAVLIQRVVHPGNESCTPARQAEQDNTQDIACLLDTFEPFVSPQDNLECSNIGSFHTFPALFRVLVEIVSQLEGTDLATNYSEAICTLKNTVQPGLNSTVRKLCNCITDEDGEDAVACSSSQQQLEISSRSNNELCLVLSLHRTLTRLQDLLDGQNVTCTARRPNSYCYQKRELINFHDNIKEYYCDQILRIPEGFQVPDVPCKYRPLTWSMADHIKSLYTLVPPLSNLISSEAQLITGNLTEVILPIIESLVDASFGEGFYERTVNSSTPLASVSTLSEQERTVCFVNRLRITYNYFIDELGDENIIVQNDRCPPSSSSS